MLNNSKRWISNCYFFFQVTLVNFLIKQNTSAINNRIEQNIFTQSTFSKLLQIVFNYASIKETISEEINSFDLKIREALKNVCETDDVIKALLMCALDLANNGGKLLPTHVTQFYAEWLGQHWQETVPHTRTQLLADIPPDIVASHMHRFDISLDDYTNHRFTSL